MKQNSLKTNIMLKSLEKKIDELRNHKEYRNGKLEDIYEVWEYQERQVKFIIQGQRVYDYFGFDWYLPFWDASVVRFWSEMPIELEKTNIYIKII